MSASFPEAIRGSEPLELEGGSEPYDKGAGNQIQVLCKSSAHAELPLQPRLSGFYYYYIYVYVCLHVGIDARCLQRPEEASRSPGSVVTGSEPPRELQKQTSVLCNTRKSPCVLSYRSSPITMLGAGLPEVKVG